MLSKAAKAKEINGLKISRRGPAITHLFFADDTLVFCKAQEKETRKLMEILKQYEKGSGQLINLEKSSVLLSKNADQESKERLCTLLGGIMPVTQGKYLGLPMVVTRTKDQIFGFIRDKVKKRLQTWKNKLLSTEHCREGNSFESSYNGHACNVML